MEVTKQKSPVLEDVIETISKDTHLLASPLEQKIVIQMRESDKEEK